MKKLIAALAMVVSSVSFATERNIEAENLAIDNCNTLISQQFIKSGGDINSLTYDVTAVMDNNTMVILDYYENDHFAKSMYCAIKGEIVFWSPDPLEVIQFKEN